MFLVITAVRKMVLLLQVLDSMKSQTPITKSQTNLKLQSQITKTGLEFCILVIVICLLFEICNLEFSVAVADCRKREKSIIAPSGGRSVLGPLQLFQLLVKARRDQILKLFAQVALVVHEFNPNLLPKFK